MSDLDRFKRSFAAMVKRIMNVTDYLALYPSTVIVQNGDGTLEVRPDSPKIAGLSKVPLRLGIPGCVVQVAPGARVLVGFENGDPTRFYAATWDGGTLLALSVGPTPLPVAQAPALAAWMASVGTFATAVQSALAGAAPVAALQPGALAVASTLSAVVSVPPIATTITKLS